MAVKFDPILGKLREQDVSSGAGTGDVVGPSSATDNAIARYDTTTGKLLQDSGILIDDDDKLVMASTVNDATGNEIAFTLGYTVNKATSGNDTGLLISMTDTASPGTSLPLDVQVGGSSIFNINESGEVAIGGVTPVAGTKLLLPLENDAATPTFAFGDSDSGFYEESDDVIALAIGGSKKYIFDTNRLAVSATNGAQFKGSASTVALPGVANVTDTDTGIHFAGSDQLALVAGAKEMLRVVETGIDTTDQLIIAPAGVIGASATPALAFGDGDTGFYESADDTLFISVAGSDRWRIEGNSFYAVSDTYNPRIRSQSSSSLPTIIPQSSDTDTGLAATGSDVISVYAGGVEMIQFKETGVSTTDQVIIYPSGAAGATTTPALAFGDGDTGFYESADDVFRLSVGGSNRYTFRSTVFDGSTDTFSIDVSTAASSTNPTYSFKGDEDTGLSKASADNPCIVAGGLEAARFEDPADLAAGETSLWIYDDDNATLEQVTVGAADSGGSGFKVLRIPN